MSRLTGRSINWPPRRDRRRSRRRRGAQRRRRQRVALVFIGLFVALVAWAALDVRSARRDLTAARAELTSAASNLGSATDADATDSLRTATRDAVTQTARAQKRLRRSPLLRFAGVVPVINTQRDGLYRAVEVAHDAAVIGDRLTGRVESLREALTVKNSSVDVAAVTQLAAAARDAGGAIAALPRTHRGGQWSPLSNATRELDAVLSDTAHRLRIGGSTMRVAHDLLGGNGPRRLLIALQNNAEMRDQGMVLSVAVAETDNGALRVTRSASVTELVLPKPITDVQLPQGTRQVFGSLVPLQYWQSVNASADTALAGASLRSMYKAATGNTIDGVVALDVPALAKLLAITGPVNVADLGQISAENAEQLLLDDQYKGLPNAAARRERLSDVVAAVIARIQASSLNTTSLVRALGESAAGGHTWVTAGKPEDQHTLERAGLSGTPGRKLPERTIHVSVQNGSGSKLDWFIDPRVEVHVAVTPDGTAVVRTKVTMPNAAPVPTPPSEQFGPYLEGDPPGLYRARVYFWGPSNGDQLNSTPESDLRLNFGMTEIGAGQTKTVEFETTIPNAVRHGNLRLRFVPQARARPMALHVKVTALGWKVKSGGNASVQWDKTLNLAWQLSR